MSETGGALGVENDAVENRFYPMGDDEERGLAKSEVIRGTMSSGLSGEKFFNFEEDNGSEARKHLPDFER